MRFLLLLILCSLMDSAEGTAQTYQLTFTHAELIQNEHVGNEWARGVWLDEEPMRADVGYRLVAGKAYELSIAAAETQEKYNDRGDESITFTTADLQRAAADGGFYLDVTVRESSGRYAGGEAIWRFYFGLE